MLSDLDGPPAENNLSILYTHYYQQFSETSKKRLSTAQGSVETPVLSLYNYAINRNQEGTPLNTLAYGLLGLVARTPSSGYDLMLQLQPFWQAKHSQIYPLLAKMEQEGYLEFTRVPQTDRPDKKVYSITEKGRTALREWLTQSTSSRSCATSCF